MQVDHRVPYEVAGESEGDRPETFMLLCASCNRTKSWACEHCKNWLEIRKPHICKSCYWASLTSYRHVAMADIRRADVSWLREEVKTYERLRAASEKVGKPIQAMIKEAVSRLVE